MSNVKNYPGKQGYISSKIQIIPFTLRLKMKERLPSLDRSHCVFARQRKKKFNPATVKELNKTSNQPEEVKPVTWHQRVNASRTAPATPSKALKNLHYY